MCFGYYGIDLCICVSIIYVGLVYWLEVFFFCWWFVLECLFERGRGGERERENIVVMF